jgi:predicted lysophospholipase L1 biosynthesis ABC-type transport system permease subunit
MRVVGSHRVRKDVLADFWLSLRCRLSSRATSLKTRSHHHQLTAHLEQLAEDFERQGLSATESRRQAGIAERGLYAQPLTVLMAMVSLVLLLACANIANLMLARGAMRQREMSVRLALGAGRGRILRQMLVESLTLAAAGGKCGLLLGYLGRNALPRMLAKAWDEHPLYVQFDWSVFAFSAAVTIAAGLLFGLAPAIAASREEIGHGLKLAVATATRRRKRLAGGALIAFQVALSTLLVIAAGLFLRTLLRLKAVDVGLHFVLEPAPVRDRAHPGTWLRHQAC